MKSILCTVCVFLPFIALSQHASRFLPRELRAKSIKQDYNDSAFKYDKKETVRLLREYLENKDRELEEVNYKIIEVNNEIARNVIDTGTANMYLANVKNKPDQEINNDIRRYLREMGLEDEIDNKKSITELEETTNRVIEKKTEYRDYLGALDTLNISSENIKQDISRAHKRIDFLYAKVYDEGSFRVLITVIFSSIVASLLLFFFIFIGRRSESPMAKEFLSSGNGLQFITLFSLITAIILFGVLGILEGRELAAILSGISGYILGKGINNPKTQQQRMPDEQKPEKHVPTVANNETESN